MHAKNDRGQVCCTIASSNHARLDKGLLGGGIEEKAPSHKSTGRVALLEWHQAMNHGVIQTSSSFVVKQNV